MFNAAIRSYHAWREKANFQFEADYYPGHTRVPNPIVQLLYSIGHFFSDFVPLTINLIEGIYKSIKRLLTFIVGLLIEASTVVVLIGTVVFSISHSIELLRRAEASGGMEYVGVAMFELVFISSTATLTGMLMKGSKNVFRSIGFWFCLGAFLVGVSFVLWSNITAMAPTWEGMAIGILTPTLLIIAEGLLAFRNVNSEEEKPLAKWARENKVNLTEIMEITHMMKENHISPEELKHQLKASTEVIESPAEPDLPKEPTPEPEEEATEEDKPTETEQEEVKEIPAEPAAETPEKEETRETEEVVVETPEPAVETPETKTAEKAEATEESKKKEVKKEKAPTNLSEKRTEKDVARAIAMQIWMEEGKPPGRDRIMNETGCGSSIARNLAKELKEEAKKKAS